jgi:hypothetical protein
MSQERVRFAQFNIWELSRSKLDEVDEIGQGTNPQLLKAAEILQRIRPDVLLINEIDFDEAGLNLRLFESRYLAVSQAGLSPLQFPHVYFEAVNTGVPSGYDLDRDGNSDGPGDCWGYGRYPGQYGMGLLSVHPIQARAARTFRLLRWADMPGNLMPDGHAGKPGWYEPEVARVLRLSSKSHWDVPLMIGDHVVHVLSAHPTPPVFDGPEDRNGRRNFDEIRLLADYIAGGDRASYIVDDSGQPGPLPPSALFVIMGDMNADIEESESPHGQPAIAQLLSLDRVQDARPASAGALATLGGGHAGLATTSFGRIDYVLPSKGLEIEQAGLFWPGPNDPQRQLCAPPEPASDHRPVWVDIRLP